jgi:hypothetical protein
MQTISKQLTVKEVDTSEAEFVSTTYECDVVATLAHDGIWDCELTDADEVRIKTINVNEGVAGSDMDGYLHVGVVYTVNGEEEYEGSWRIYTDSGFEECVSELLGFSVSFTEQGMQDDGFASME